VNIIDAIEARFGYRFRNHALLRQALTHCSSATKEHNQRMEFLGDALLGHVISSALYTQFPHANEGELSQRKVALVNGGLLAQMAHAHDLGGLLLMSDGEEAHDGRTNHGNLEDALEALLGAIYLDGGYDAAEALILRVWGPHIHTLKEAPKDPKTALQEWGQARGLGLPEYALIAEDGPAHAPEFLVEARMHNESARATAGSKKQAERLAAEALLGALTDAVDEA
jgi:ribonuclease-3